MTLVGETVQEVLLVAKLTTPAKPLMAVTVMVEMPVDPAFTVTLVGLAPMAKSCTTMVTVMEWDKLPLVPVTPTWNVPVEVNAHDSVELPEAVTLVGESEHEVLLVVRLTTPAKPFTAVTVIVEVPAVFTLTLMLDGLADMVKS